MVIVRIAIFFMMSLSHFLEPPPCSAIEAIMRGTGGRNHCAGDQFAESVLTATLSGATIKARTAQEPGVARSDRITHNEDREAPRADPESHRA
jgi:hypothetical protein